MCFEAFLGFFYYYSYFEGTHQHVVVLGIRVNAGPWYTTKSPLLYYPSQHVTAEKTICLRSACVVAGNFQIRKNKPPASASLYTRRK